MTGEEITSEHDQEKKAKNIFKQSSSLLKCFLVIISTAAVFLVGQYQLAGSVLFAHSYETLHDKTIMIKHRRELTLQTENKDDSPKLLFPKNYHAKGVLKLPYGEIEEPFEAWYARDEKMSRIDYYGGMDRTYQRGDIGEYGFAAKVVPEYSEENNKTFRGCLHHVGTKRFPIHAQSIVPSPKSFKFKGDCILNKTIKCWKWFHKFTILTKMNRYTLYTSRSDPIKPLRYEMMGYDTLLTSYYDKYILDYDTFDKWDFDFKLFEIPTELHCFDLSEREASETTVSSFNPMLEFISHENEQIKIKYKSKPTKMSNNSGIPEDLEFNTLMGKKYEKHHYEFVVESVFREFRNLFEKNYTTDIEHVQRKDIFRHNMRYINKKNRENLSFKLKINHFADVTEKEMQRYKGLLNESYQDNNAKKFIPPNIDLNVTPIPKFLDWREYGAVSEVPSQGICGSCYAYAVTGAIEGAYYLKTGDLISLSEQQIVDCSWGFGNKGCKGGYPYRALQWLIKHGGIATHQSYGKYLAQEGYCHFNNITTGAIIEDYFNVTSSNSTELKIALAMYGPVTILINTRPRSFKFYNEGVYYDSDCDNRLDHAALVIGYGETEKGEDYWLIKNTWSMSWGDKGYIKIAAKHDNCGVTQKPVVVKVKA